MGGRKAPRCGPPEARGLLRDHRGKAGRPERRVGGLRPHLHRQPAVAREPAAQLLGPLSHAPVDRRAREAAARRRGPLKARRRSASEIPSTLDGFSIFAIFVYIISYKPLPLK